MCSGEMMDEDRLNDKYFQTRTMATLMSSLPLSANQAPKRRRGPRQLEEAACVMQEYCRSSQLCCEHDSYSSNITSAARTCASQRIKLRQHSLAVVGCGDDHRADALHSGDRNYRCSLEGRKMQLGHTFVNNKSAKIPLQS
nr:hypothetical protein CFP56_26026 [Quercus suber]